MKILCLFLVLTLFAPQATLNFLEQPTEVIEVAQETREVPKVYAEVTAYTASDEECGKNDGITASGTKAVEGRTVAADDIPMGTAITIDGHRYIVEDCFGGGYRGRIDVFMEEPSRAMDFGRRTMEITVETEE